MIGPVLVYIYGGFIFLAVLAIIAYVIYWALKDDKKIEGSI